MHRAFGIPVVVATTVVGSTVFASIGQSAHIALVIMTGMLSIGAAVLSSLQTFLNYSGDSEKHKIASVKYGMLRREIEQFLEDPDGASEVLREFQENFRARWNQVEMESPPIPQRIHDQSHAQLMKHLEEEKARRAIAKQSTV
jgi:hypothetical protein